MLLIIAHHYVVNSGLMVANGPIYMDLWSARSLFLLVFGAFGKMGINCFVMISGYFMCTSRITAKKFAKLLLEVEFYKIVIYLVFAITGYENFSVSGFVKAVLPFTSVAQNFTGCYLIFYLLIPFLNVTVHHMSEKQHLYLVLLLVFVYVLIGTLLSGNLTMNYVTWFVVIYFLAAYVRLYPKGFFNKTKVWGILSAATFVFSVLSVVVCVYLVQHYNIGSLHFFLVDANKVLAVVTAFCSFMFFKNIQVKQCLFINTAAASAFGVLLIHANSATMRKFLWQDVLCVADMYDSAYLVIHACLSVIGIYIVCAVVDYLRIRFLEKPFFKMWDKHWGKVEKKYLHVENAVCSKLKIKTE